MTESELIERASALTAQVGWAKKYRQQWLMIAVASYNAQMLLSETAKPDRGAYDFLESTRNTALTKCDKLQVWINKNEADQNRLMQEVDPDVAVNR